MGEKEPVEIQIRVYCSMTTSLVNDVVPSLVNDVVPSLVNDVVPSLVNDVVPSLVYIFDLFTQESVAHIVDK